MIRAIRPLVLTGGLGLGFVSALAGCAPRERTVRMVVRLPAEIDPHEVVVGPPWAVRASTATHGEVAIEARAGATRVTVQAPGLCPLTLQPSAGAVVEATPYFDLGGDRGQIGFGTPFTIDVAFGCGEAKGGRVVWKQIEGPPLLDLAVEEGGLRLRGRTRPLVDLHVPEVSWGIVPTSPRTQGRYVLEATWSGDGPTLVRRVTVTSIARATGVPSLAVGQRVMLAGQGWHVRQAAPGGHARVETIDGVATFAADITGHWLLEDGAGAHLGLREGRFDGTPLGCGTKNCHSQETDALERSPMTVSLVRHMREGAPREDISCMLDCHVEGERGLHDGGFLDRAASMRWSPDRATLWDDVPRTLRRMGGVGCTACHGPGAIPEPTASRAILRADVCATCHDAPPNYVHVEQWRSSRMARSDASPSTRSSFACARCHMTSQFLADQRMWGIRFADEDDRHAEPAGIGCAACHASHALHPTDQAPAPLTRKMLREVDLPAWMVARPWAPPTAAGAVCIPCHAPGIGEPLPSASAAAIWAGVAPRGDLPNRAGPHDKVTCVGCHGGADHTDHSFRAQAAACVSCHGAAAVQTLPTERPDAQGVRVRERAKAILLALGTPAEPLAAPDHASWATPPSGPVPTDPATARALYEVELVLEDPAAGFHNAPFARALLADAASVVTAAAGKKVAR